MIGWRRPAGDYPSGDRGADRRRQNAVLPDPGIAVGRAESKPLVVSTANVALQDQIYSKDLPLLKKIIPDLKFTRRLWRGRYVCPRNWRR